LGIVEIESQWTVERRKALVEAEEVNNPILPKMKGRMGHPISGILFP
jgi:hypothetical protein